MYVQRFAEEKFLRYSRNFKAVTVSGPRGAGKTVMLKHLAEPGRTYVSLDDTDTLALARTDPKMFFMRYRPPVIIDEAQKAPVLYQYIKLICDSTDERSLFWMASSEEYTFLHTDCESLAGRQGLISLYPLSYAEVRGIRFTDPFDLSFEHLLSRSRQAGECNTADLFRYIWQGGLPEAQGLSLPERREYYEGYMLIPLLKDAVYLCPGIQEAVFIRFLEACAGMIGQTVSCTALAKAAGISVSAAKKWISVLEGMHVLFLLPPYCSYGAMKGLCKRPVMYFTDTGLASYLAKWMTDEALMAGKQSSMFLRNYAAVEIMKDMEYRSVQCSLEHYRDSNGNEIPLIMTYNRDMHPLDIQMTDTPECSEVKKFQTLQNGIWDRSSGGIICLCPSFCPLDRKNSIIPANIL